jgi:hypothetical protein
LRTVVFYLKVLDTFEKFLVYRTVLDMFEDSCGLSQGAGTNLRGAIRNQIGTNF